MSEGWSQRRWGGAGVLLVALLVVLLVVPLWKHRALDHPLSALAELDPCPVLPPAPAELGRATAKRLDPRSSICVYVDDQGKQLLSVTISTTRQMSAERPTDSQYMYELWMKEVHASYGASVDAPGPWRHGAAWQVGKDAAFLFEDGGVIVNLESSALDATGLRRHAERVQHTLRKE